jgi:signal transduction histidine kinase
MDADWIGPLRPVFDCLTDGVCIADASGRLLYANAAAGRHLGRGPAEAEPSAICDLLCGRLEGGEADAAACPLRRPGPEDSTTRRGKYASRGSLERGGALSGPPEGRDLRVRCQRLKLRGEESHLILIEDVSAEAALARRQEEWRNTLAHDLRVPLANALGALRTLEEMGAGRPLTEEDLELVRIGVRACRRIEGLIEIYLEVARLEAGAMPVHAELLDAAALARECAADSAAAARAKGVELAAELDARLPVSADPDLLRRSLMNLIDNALKFTPAGGRVTVRASARGDAVLLRVSDTGPGIAAEDLPRVFDRFYQAGGRRGVGLGLGLTFCRASLRAMGGDILVESEPGKGSAFTLTLPSAKGGGT